MREFIVEKSDEVAERIVKYSSFYKGEIIRCADCKYWQDNNGGYPHPDCKWNANETPDADDYCSGAERREE